jgi:DNA-binding response OmpR family regulator
VDSRRSVLIVDESAESREVLRTVLEHRGMRILEASRAQEGLDLARQHQPDLIVLDLELDSSPPEFPSELAAQATHRTPLVLLGSARRLAAGPQVGEFMAKPYHYAPLIRKIEQLLERVCSH